MAKNVTNSDVFKEILSAHAGGDAADWKRVSKKKVYGGDIERAFENKNTSEKASIYERSDGLLYAELANGKEITARVPLSGKFNAAAEPAVVDRVMNAILEDKEVDDKLYAQAVKEGLATRFSFAITQYDDQDDDGNDVKSTYTTIYPTVRDETFKAPSFIRPLVTKCDDTDECVVTEYRFDKGIDTPAQIVKHLQGLGLVWDEESQKRDKSFYSEIKKELKGQAHKAKGLHA